MDPRVSKRLFCSFYNLQYFPRLFFRKYASLPDGTIPVFENLCWQADGVVGESNGSAQIRDIERPDAKGFPNAQPHRLPVRFWDCNLYVLILMYYVRSL